MATILQARAGIGRVNATRSGYITSHNALVTINGVSRTGSVFKSTISITDVLSPQYRTATLSVFGFVPVVGQTVTIGLGDAASHLIFGGRILSLTTRVGSRLSERTVYDLQCVDYSWDLNRRLVFHAFQDQPATDLVTSLMAAFTSGFTVAHVQTGLPTVTGFTAEFETVTDCLDRLARIIGGYWYVDDFKDLHFFISETLGTTPETLSSSSSHEWRALQHTKDLSQIRTRVYAEAAGEGAQLLLTRTAVLPAEPTGTAIFGASNSGNDVGLPLNVMVNGYGTADFWRVDQSMYQPATGTRFADTYVSDGNALEAHKTTTSSAIAVGDTSISVGSTSGFSTTGGGVIIDGQVIAYGAAAGGVFSGVPASGQGSVLQVIASGADVIQPPEVRFLGSRVGQTHVKGAYVRTLRQRNATAAQTALAALDGSDGIREHFVSESQLGYLAAAARGDAELLMWQDPVQVVTFESRDPALRAGKTVTISAGGITGTYRVQRVAISDIEEAPALWPWRSVDASSQRFDFYDLLARTEGR